MKDISIIITTKNEETRIGACLEAVYAQDYSLDNLEILVIDNNSCDRTKEIASKMGAKVFNYGPERSAQRNFGISRAKSPYILYLDADMRLSKNVLSECMKKCQDEGYAALYIPEKIVGSGFWIKVRDFERSFYNGSCIDAVRFLCRDVFLKAGGFDENFNEGEDWDLDRRVRSFGKVGSIKAPLYHDEGAFSLKIYFKKKGSYSKNLYRYVQKWGKGDPIIMKQMGIFYRFFGVFFENCKFIKMLIHPGLTLGMYFLRIGVGLSYLMNRKAES